MAEQWKALGRTTAQALIGSTAAQLPLGPSFANACTELTSRRLQMYTLANGGHAVAQAQVINLGGPTAMLGEASRALERYNELHNRFGRVLSIHGGLLDVLVDAPLWRGDLTLLPAADPVWQSWVQGRANTLHYIHWTTERLRAAAVYDLATVDAFNLAQSFPEHSQDWIEWMRVAETHAARAATEALEASRGQFEMNAWDCVFGAVISEYCHGMQILHR